MTAHQLPPAVAAEVQRILDAAARRILAERLAEKPSEKLMTAFQLGARLHLSPNTILDMWERGDLPGFKVGRAVRFRPSEIDVWLEKRRRGPAA